MAVTGNTFNNNRLTQMVQQAGPGVINAIRNASARTGVNFAYLVEKAAAESSFDTKAQSGTSSAAGLYQFIESTWLQMVKTHGEKYGLGEYAKHIDEKGKVDSAAMRKEILDLRKDPQAAASMAAEFAAGNQRYLESHLDGKNGEIGSTELYLAHFMGAGGATAFLKAYQDTPLAAAADLFPKAARANRGVFYDSKTGQPRTLTAVYDFFDKKFSAGDTGAPSAGAAAMASITPPRKPGSGQAVAQQAATGSSGQGRFHADQSSLLVARSGVPSFFTAGQDSEDTANLAAQASSSATRPAGRFYSLAAADAGVRVVPPTELLFLAQLQAPGNLGGHLTETRSDDDEKREKGILKFRSSLFTDI